METFSDDRQRRTLEWQLCGEFKEGNVAVRVNRARQTKRFSLEIGAVAQDGGQPRRFIPLRWEVEGGGVVIKEPADVSLIAALIGKAAELVKTTLEKEGVRERRPEKEPMRKGKTERDRQKRRERSE
jgi:hypothetical protein